MDARSPGIVEEAENHLATLPDWLKSRYSSDLIAQLVEEVKRLRIVIDCYVGSSKAAAEEINCLRSGKIVKVPDEMDD